MPSWRAGYGHISCASGSEATDRPCCRIARQSALGPGLGIDDAADVVWATASSELFVLLTGERDWTLDRYERFLLDTWRRLLLEHQPH